MHNQSSHRQPAPNQTPHKQPALNQTPHKQPAPNQTPQNQPEQNQPEQNHSSQNELTQNQPVQNPNVRQAAKQQRKDSVSPMSNEGRNLYVLSHLTDALLALLEEKQMEDISIRELCDSAGVGRASFYRNFNSKEDILRAHIGRLFGQWKASLEETGNLPLHTVVGMLFAYFEQHRAFFQLLNERRLIYLLKDVLLDIFELKPELPKLEAYSKAYVAYVFYGWIEVWFQRGMQESAEEMKQMFQDQGL